MQALSGGLLSAAAEKEGKGPPERDLRECGCFGCAREASEACVRRSRRRTGLLLESEKGAGRVGDGGGARPAEWCTSRESWSGWTRAQLTTADSRAG